ncbi:MAG: hypothetical protein AAGA76_09895 [Pseudomonadota bacterium]
MKSVMYGLSAMVVISIIAWAVMEGTATSSGERFTSQNNSVRLDQ